MQFCPTYGGRDVIPNKTTQTPLWGLGNGAVTQLKGPQETNPVVLRPTQRECILRYPFIGVFGNPTPYFPKGDNAVWNTEFWYDTSLKSLTDGPGVMHPAGGILSRDSIADSVTGHDPRGLTRPYTKNQVVSGIAGDNNRINPFNLRHTQKDTGMYFAINRPFNSNRTLAPQYTEFPLPVDRKVTPFIQQDVDPSLMNPWYQNPYTIPYNPQ